MRSLALYVNTTENQIKGAVSARRIRKKTVKLYKAESGPVRPVLRKCYSRVSGGGWGLGGGGTHSCRTWSPVDASNDTIGLVE